MPCQCLVSAQGLASILHPEDGQCHGLLGHQYFDVEPMLSEGPPSCQFLCQHFLQTQ